MEAKKRKQYKNLDNGEKKNIKMFAYDTTFISSLLKCQRCSTNYNDYNEPRSLPCCGKTICSKCIEPLEKASINAMFTCNMCNKKSLLNPSGFPINEVVAKIVSEQPKEVYRGKEIQKLKIARIMNTFSIIMIEILNKIFRLIITFSN
jgi:hypothetical protein